MAKWNNALCDFICDRLVYRLKDESIVLNSFTVTDFSSLSHENSQRLGAFYSRVQTSFAGSSNKQKIFAAMAEWREKTCLKFVQRTGQKNYVEFITSGGG
jgi:hypothetical protein